MGSTSGLSRERHLVVVFDICSSTTILEAAREALKRRAALNPSTPEDLAALQNFANDMQLRH